MALALQFHPLNDAQHEEECNVDPAASLCFVMNNGLSVYPEEQWGR